MPMDRVIRNGLVVDGTGGPARRADVGIDDGRIVELGRVTSRGAEEIDADGLVVTPGFIDIHTHYDAQALWDPTYSPSPLHGITTAIGGNCGFSLAPAGPDQAHYLLSMLSRVEGMEQESLEAAVEWTWDDMAGFLDLVDQPSALNVGYLAGHSSIRRAVMGDRAVGEIATDDELDRMAQLLGRSLAAGALGFSSSNAGTHHDGAGDPVPSRFSTEKELFRLCAELRAAPGTFLEYIPLRAADEAARMAAMSLVAGRPLNWNILFVASAKRDAYRADMETLEFARQQGAVVTGLTLPDLMQQRLNFRTMFILDVLPGWNDLAKMPLDQRREALGRPDTRSMMRQGASSAGARRRELTSWADYLICEVSHPELTKHEGRVVADLAAEQGLDPFDALLDLVIADELATVVMPPTIGSDDASWDDRVDVWRHPDVLLGASDAGAHLDMVAHFNFPTVMLAESVRQHARLPIEEAVHLLTGKLADFAGLTDRGVLAPGAHADLVVLDPDRVGTQPVTTRHDMPAGAARLYAGATGIEHVIVNGRTVVRGDDYTGELSGRLLRSGHDTHTVPVPADAGR